MQAPIVLRENDSRLHLFPLTLTRSVADLRMGMLTIREKWAQMTGNHVSVLPEGIPVPDGAEVFPANLLPLQPPPSAPLERQSWIQAQPRIERCWQISHWNAQAIAADFALLTRDRQTEPVPASVRCTTPGQIFIEPDARLEHCILNASDGPVYIGRGARIMDGAILRGPVAVMEGSIVKMGAMIYGGTTIGPYCTVGGEIKNSVLQDYSNKAHEGYLGDAFVGSWCNLGAGTNCSNLKNSGRPVGIWNEHLQLFETGPQKCGLIMGDYSRSAINTAFNTGTVTGISCNIFSPGMLTPAFIPSFSWGRDASTRYEIDRVIEDIGHWMALKKQALTPGMETLIRNIYTIH